jgi:diguanylate cyclase (GGDEF)-like protein
MSQPRQRPSGRELAAGSWLCRDEVDRERMLDMDERVRPVRRRAFAILAAAIVAVGPWAGWWPLLFLLPVIALFAIVDVRLARAARPEYLMFTAWLLSELAIAGAVALQGGPHVAELAWIAIPVIALSSLFSMRGVVAGVVVACVLVFAVAFGVDAAAVIAGPDLVIAPFALVLCIAVLSTPLMHSDIEHRNDAVVDQLTGMLNRKALGARVQELAQQSELAGDPVGVIVADLDHFKNVNDTRGHAVGDVVLTEVAYTLRRQLRAFELAYRLGGEEFVVLVPGADLDETLELGERLRAAVCAEPISDGIRVTLSVGIGASERGEHFDYSAVFAEADEALYCAKRGGRNRVSLAERHSLPSAA